MGTEPVLPFLKWPGGKRWAAPAIAALLREHLTGKYFEPFLGGGAVFFHLRPSLAVLSDINSDLINTYRVVQTAPTELLAAIRAIPVNQSEYYCVRAQEPSEPIARAVRFLYLNRTAFGGMYRLNQAGKFNVPYGGGARTPAILWENGLLLSASEALSSATICESDFESMLALAGSGDVVYCDPTYTVAHDVNGFIRYNERNFSWADQERLATACQSACSRGVFVIVSNAHHPLVAALYPTAEVRTLSRKSLISRKPDMRRDVSEFLFILSPLAD